MRLRNKVPHFAARRTVVGCLICRPHLIEVVHLGRRAVAVCHDCRRDSGFLPEREADRLAYAHRQETDGDEYSIFSSWVA